MKQFILFVGVNYYPGTPSQTFIFHYDTLREAKDEAAFLIYKKSYEWAEIIDTELKEYHRGYKLPSKEIEWENKPLQNKKY